MPDVSISVPASEVGVSVVEGSTVDIAVTVSMLNTIDSTGITAPTDGAYKLEGGFLKLWDAGTSTYRKVWLYNGGLAVE